MNKKRILITIIAVAILGSATVAFAYTKQVGPFASGPVLETTQKTSGDDSADSADTKTAVTEGTNVQIPNDVDPSSIKPHELIVENERYKIRKLGDIYTITLYAIINNPSQADMYRDQLKQYKADSLEYLRNTGVDIDKVTVVYEPDEAKDL